MTLEYTHDIPPIDAFWALVHTTGWTIRAQPEEYIAAIQQCWYRVSVFDGEKLVGFARVINDGTLHAMIYDLIVLPEYQGQGIGAQILSRILAHCREAGIHKVELFSAKGKAPFYEKYGFHVRPVEQPGMDQILS
jgi:GNAT superfamily N-acetyltransferase